MRARSLLARADFDTWAGKVTHGPPPPAGVDAALLTAVIEEAAASVVMPTPASDTVGARELVWGDQVDIKPIASTDPAPGGEGWRDGHVAGYVAKYATKGTGLTEGSDFPIRSAEHIETLPITEHHKQIMRTAWHLGDLVEFEELNLRKWAHMLGFRGHFLTKSRRYSTTFTAIRRTRAEYRLDQEREALGLLDYGDLHVVNDWNLTGIGYRSTAERQLAAVFSELHLATRHLQGQDDKEGG